MRASRSNLLKQFAIAAIGQALPQESVLSDAAADFQKGLIATLVLGILASALILFGCFEFYTFLLSEGLSRSTVSLMTVMLLLMLMVISGLAASHYSKRVVKVKESISPFPQSNEWVAGAETLITAFMRGFNGSSEANQVRQPVTERVDIGRAYVYAKSEADESNAPNGRLPH